MLFGLDRATQTFILFLFSLIFFFIVLSTYFSVSRSYLQKVQKKGLLSDWRIWAVCLVYAVVFGFRYNYLNDWEQYVSFFEHIQSGGDNDGWREPGFFLLVKGLSSLGFSYYSLFVLECFLWFFSLCYLFKDNRNYLVFVIPFVFISATNEALNVSRQYLALSFLLIALKDYWSGNYIKALLIALVAPLMHYSSLIWLIVFIFLKRIDYIKPFWMVTIFLFVTFLSSLFYDVLASSTETISTILNVFFENSIYDKAELDALQSETVGASFRQMLTLGFTRGSYIFLYYYYRKHNLLKEPILNNFVLIGMIGIIVILLLGYNMIFSRIAAYIKVFYNIGWGILTYITITNRRFVSSNCKILVLLVMIYLYGAFLLNISEGRLSQIKDVNPYLIYEKYL